MSKTQEELLEEVISNAKAVGIQTERLRIIDAVQGLGIPFIPLATLRRLLNEVKDDETV